LATALRLPAVIGVMVLIGGVLQLASLHVRSRSMPGFKCEPLNSPD
jgi:hypothetical protein